MHRPIRRVEVQRHQLRDDCHARAESISHRCGSSDPARGLAHEAEQSRRRVDGRAVPHSIVAVLRADSIPVLSVGNARGARWLHALSSVDLVRRRWVHDVDQQRILEKAWNDGTTERWRTEGREDGTTGTEETQTAADKTGTAAETTEDQKAPKQHLERFFLKRRSGCS